MPKLTIQMPERGTNYIATGDVNLVPVTMDLTNDGRVVLTGQLGGELVILTFDPLDMLDTAMRGMWALRARQNRIAAAK